MRDSDQCSASSVFWSFILGGIVGAGVTLLMAPQTGKEAIEKINEFAEAIKDKI